MLDHRSEPGSYMAPELADGAKSVSYVVDFASFL